MSQFDASNADCEYVQCAVCDQVIRGGKWFARIRHGDRLVALCCPLCTEAFKTRAQAYVRRIETLEFRRQSQPDSPLND